MADYSLTILVVLYKEQRLWIAHCLEFDIAGEGKTRRAACNCLLRCIKLQISESLPHSPCHLFFPAPSVLWQRFAAGSVFEQTAIGVDVNGLVLEGVQVREFTG